MIIKILKKVKILSLLSIPTNFIKKNVILNFNDLRDQIELLISETEKLSQTKLNSLNLDLSLLNSKSYYYHSNINIKNEKISELHLKKIINQSEYFEIYDDQFELFNNIISYTVDNNNYFFPPLGNFADNIKINFYKILIKKNISKIYLV